MKNFENKTVVITGAASGLGQALAIRLAAEKANLVLADIDAGGLAQTVQLCEGFTGTIRKFVVDVSRRGAVEKFAAAVGREFGAVDVVINNAGVALAQTIEDMDYADFEWVMNINFWGVVYGSKAFLPWLKKAPESYLINISSIFGLIAVPTQGAYNASKFAVRGFTEALHEELIDTSVNVICVHPGGIKTNIARNARFFKGFVPAADRETSIASFDRLALTSPDEAASTIIGAIQKGRNRLLIGPDAWVVDIVQRLAPNFYKKLLLWYLKSPLAK